MKFSNYANRFQQDSGILQLMADLGAAQYTQEPICMLGGGNPAHIPEVEHDFQQELLRLAGDPKEFGKMVGDYDGPQGNVEFIEALANLLNREYDWPITAENIAITNGSQSSFGIIFNALAGEYSDGSFKKVLLPLTPEYIGYAELGTSEQDLFEANKPLIEKLPNGFFKYHIDFENLAIDERYGAVCVSRPTNPSGNVINDAELTRLADLCRKADVPLVIDGAYGLPFPSMIFSDAKPLWDENIVLCLSLSKLGLPGVRTGIVIAQPALINIIKGANAINSLAPGRIGPSMVTRLLNDGSLVALSQQKIKPFYQARMQLAVDCIQTEMQHLPVRVHQPEGALFLWLWFEGLPMSCEALYRKLKAAGVLVIAGHHFYPGLNEDWSHKHECIRISYAADAHVVKTGIKKIAEIVSELYQA